MLLQGTRLKCKVFTGPGATARERIGARFNDWHHKMGHPDILHIEMAQSANDQHCLSLAIWYRSARQ